MSTPFHITRALLANERQRAREAEALIVSILGVDPATLPAATHSDEGSAAPLVTIPAEQPASPLHHL